MCELFMMSSSSPASATYSMREFARHGGLTADNVDGWGLAYVEERDVRLFRSVDAAADSAYLSMVSGWEFESETVVSHIRRATQGARTLSNTQPFRREMGGRVHLFAHNGDLDWSKAREMPGRGRFRAIGETDSELAFCELLERLWPLWSEVGEIPDVEAREWVFIEFAEDMRRLGPANFVYTDGDVVLLHGHRRKNGASNLIEPPGLHILCRSCDLGSGALDLPGLVMKPTTQRVVLAASVPLTNEAWVPLEEGKVVMIRRGEIFHRATPGVG